MLQVHCAPRADVLVDALAAELTEPPDDPFTPEVVAVHSRGIERWVLQMLSHRLGASAPEAGDGIGANIDFPFPGRLVADVLWRLIDHDPTDVADPWRPARLAWPLLDVLDEAARGTTVLPVRRQLEQAPERRFGLARHLADLFDRYGAHRPGMIRKWIDGLDVDASGGPLAEADVWQAALWRQVRERVGVPSPAERMRDLDRLADPGVAERMDLPARIHAFGLTAVPAAYVDVLAALAWHRDVHLWLLHPSRALWRAIERQGPADRGPRRDDRTAATVNHPLLRSWARDVRELQSILVSARPKVTHADVDVPRDTVLRVLQTGVRANTNLPGPPVAGATAAQDRRVVVDPDDRSVQVHGCWGTERQVEVLRDEILRLLHADPTLEPRDIIVMCPDIERYAPLVQAVLTDVDTEATGVPDLRVRLADRSLQRVNPVLRVLDEVLALVADRCTVAQVRELAAREPVARRFRFSGEDLEVIGRWIDDLGVRWGLDLEHRARHGLAGIDARTWRRALDRLLLGITLTDTDERVVAGLAPYDEAVVDVELAGRLVELVDRIAWAVNHCDIPRTPAGWREALLELCSAFVQVPTDDQAILDEVGRVLDGLVDEAGDQAVDGPELSLAEVREALDGRLGGRPGRANHRTGDLTVCTLVPMRAVPHRVVCLLGLDDGAFPRRTTTDGDDLLDREPWVGDRDPRTEDRQLLLDALMSAGEALIITYSAHDPRTGDERPPAVPVDELCAAVRDAVRAHDGAEVAVRHDQPLQAHAVRNFDGSGSRGFDRIALASARAAQASPAPAPLLVPAPLDAPEVAEVSVTALTRFVEHPVRGFVRERLGTWLDEVGDVRGDTVPANLDNLTRWQLRDEQLGHRVAGTETRWRRHLFGRDVLPPGRLGTALMEENADAVTKLLAVAEHRVGTIGPGAPLPVDLTLDGVRIHGDLSDVVARGTILHLTPSRIQAKQRLRLWVALVLASVTDPSTAWQAHVVGRRPLGKKDEVLAVAMGPLGEDPTDRARSARAHLVALLDLYRRGLSSPLPLFCATSHAFAAAVRDGSSVIAAASGADKPWSQNGYPPEQQDVYHRLAFGDEVAVGDLLDGGVGAPCPPEWGPGHSAFERLAHRLWTPIFDTTDEAHYTRGKLEQLLGEPA